jgi:hypothetical protein
MANIIITPIQSSLTLFRTQYHNGATAIPVSTLLTNINNNIKDGRPNN